jgi:hypothetical protein
VQQTDALTNAVESVLVALAHPRVLFTREFLEYILYNSLMANQAAPEDDGRSRTK